MGVLWKCPQCGSRSRNESRCNTCENWDEIADFSAPLQRQSQEQAQLHDTKGNKINMWPQVPITVIQAQRERWFHQIRTGNKGTILEIGCHRSGVLHTFKNAGWEVYGIDVSRQSVVNQNQLIPDRFAVAPAEWIPLPSESVDAVLAIHVLEHVDDLQKSLEEINRVLKPGGECFIEIPVKDFGLSWERFRFIRNPEGWKSEAAQAGHLWEKIPTSGGFAEKLESVGLNVEKVERGWVWGAPLYDYLFKRAARIRKKLMTKAIESTIQLDHKNDESTVECTERFQKNQINTSISRQGISFIVKLLDYIEHKLCPNRHHGATFLLSVRK